MQVEILEMRGDTLFDASRTRQPVAPPSESHPDITIDEAYVVQQRMIAPARGGPWCAQPGGVWSTAWP